MISKRPGRKPAFTRRQAIDAALAEGIETFTLRAVADRLGAVSYTHLTLPTNREV